MEKTLRTQLQQDGYVLVKKVVSEENCNGVLLNTVSLLEKFTRDPSLLDIKHPKKSKKFNGAMMRLRKGDPTRFGALYDTAQSSVVLSAFLLQYPVLKLVAELLGSTIAEISSSGHIQRMDPPQDLKNLYGWHQERSYYPQNRDGENGLAVWIPLVDIDENNGALVVAEGSHKEGYIESPPWQESELHSTQYTIPQKVIGRYREVSFQMKAGDALIMYMTTMHKSGENRSDALRFVTIGRYHKATAEDFTPYRYSYAFNKWKREKLKKEGWSVNDLET